MSQSHVIASGFRTNPGAAERPELKMLYWLTMLHSGGSEWDSRLARLGENMGLGAIRPSLIELAV
ncbi:hypothetical protein D9M70_632970 [compost metagenome]